MNEKKGIAILGSTGSIGTQALEVIEAFPDIFDLQVITAHSNADLLIQQAIKYQPNAVVIVDENQYEKVKKSLWEHDITVYTGELSLSQVVEFHEVHTVLTALVGYALARGYRLGLLDSSASQSAQKAYQATLSKVKKTKKGHSLGGISAATNPTPKFIYLLVPKVSDKGYGVGPFLMLASEIESMREML